MNIIDRIIGIWMMIAGGGLFIFAHLLSPYMDTLSGATLCIVAIPTAIIFGATTGALIGWGMAQAVGAVTIRVDYHDGRRGGAPIVG